MLKRIFLAKEIRVDDLIKMIILNNEVFLAKEVAFSAEIDDLTKITILKNDILRRLIDGVSLTTIALLITTENIIIITILVFVTIFVFEIIESKSLNRDKLNAFRVRKSYKI